ncbi:hypothetical protein VPH35_116547 [Triticum aestivum]
MTLWVHTPAAKLLRKKTILRDAARRQGCIAMATAEATGEGLEFLSEPVYRFPLPDLTADESLLTGGGNQTFVCTATESSIGDVGDAAVTWELDLQSECNGVALSAPNSEQSMGKDDPQAPGWTKRGFRRKATPGLAGAGAPRSYDCSDQRTMDGT